MTDKTDKKVNNNETEKTEIALHPTLQKKKERREAKAARKESNKVEEKKTRPNNIILAVLIFGVLIGMFAFAGGYNYFSKPATIEKYMEENGGKELYGSMSMDEYTVANITAKGNSMNIELNATLDKEKDSKIIESLKGNYEGDSGKDKLDNIAAYFLTSMKPLVRGFGADATVKMSINGEEINSSEITYKEVKKKIKELQKETEGAENKTEDSEENEDAD